ncbi:MAG: hypothetical protein IJJ99_08050 [Oscillospiraceae bacterium]|nr:hypothetical protein [Oscillospiraceae bacterium]
MKRSTRILLLCVLMIVVTGMLAGCYVIGEPGIDVAEKHLQHDKEDLETMVEWLLNTTYQDHVYFSRRDDDMFRDFEHLPIPEEISATAERLLHKNSYQNIGMTKEHNTIVFEYWSSIHDQSCGLAYVMDGDGQPDVQYMIQCEPLLESGWYYYYTDFNEWRVLNMK